MTELTKEDEDMNDYTGEAYDRSAFVRILVTGSVVYTNEERINRVISHAVGQIRKDGNKGVMIITTGQEGVERLALQAAKDIRTNWADFPERSSDLPRDEVIKKTLDYHRPQIVMVFTTQYDRGEAWDMISACDMAGIHVRIYPTPWKEQEEMPV